MFTSFEKVYIFPVFILKVFNSCLGHWTIFSRMSSSVNTVKQPLTLLTCNFWQFDPILDCLQGVREIEVTSIPCLKRIIVFMVLTYTMVFRQKDSAIK